MGPFAGRSGVRQQRPRRGCRETSFPAGRSAARARTFLAAKDFFAPANWGRTAVAEAMACIVLCRGWCDGRCSVLLCRGGAGADRLYANLASLPCRDHITGGPIRCPGATVRFKRPKTQTLFRNKPECARQQRAENVFLLASAAPAYADDDYFRSSWTRLAPWKKAPRGSGRALRPALDTSSSRVIDVSGFTSSDARGASSSSTRGSPPPLPWAPP